jgi:hypothetical protein
MMTTTRNGKVARLPHALREEINRRLYDGESGTPLLAWLNGLPEVRAVLAREFGGRPLNAQNLTAWRQQGYRDWQKQEEARALAERMRRETMQAPADSPAVTTEALAQSLVAHYFVATLHLRKVSVNPAKHWRMLRQISEDLMHLRQGELSARRLELAQKQAERMEQRAGMLAGMKEREGAEKNSPIRPPEGNEGDLR